MTESPALVDWPQLLALRELQEPGEPDVIGELIQMFLEDSASRMTRLRGGLAAGDAKVVVREAHSLKGSAGLLGAGQLHSDAAAVELEAGTNGLTGAGLDAMVDRLALSVSAVCRALEAGP